MNRIPWIDWAKCMAITTVVFCHLPQSQEWIYFRYLQACVITVFFFISGYLKRDRGSMGANWHRYLHALVVPYVVYNLLMLPYWVVRFYLQQGFWPDAGALLRPIAGALLLEHSSSYAEPLNGTLWYLPAILAMHLITDLCHRHRHPQRLMAVVSLFSVVGYMLYRYYEPHPSLVLTGVLRRLPFYALGYALGRRQLLRSSVSLRRCLLVAVVSLTVSILLFRWHIAVQHQHVLHILLFYPVNLLFLAFAVAVSRVGQNRQPRWVVTLSTGTLVVVGLQWMFIGAFNYGLSRLLSLPMPLCYQWYEALPVALLIVALHMPIIIAARRYAPWLSGHRNTKVPVLDA